MILLKGISLAISTGRGNTGHGPITPPSRVLHTFAILSLPITVNSVRAIMGAQCQSALSILGVYALPRVQSD